MVKLISRFLLFCAFLIVSGCLVSCRSGAKNESPDKPNVVIFLADDQGWGDLGIHGNTTISTPNIDELARQGISLERFYACPVCSLTRAEFLTGRYYGRGGVFSTSQGGERLDVDETTLAEIFKEAGYTTAAYGKWHNGMQAPYHPNARGFDDFYGFCSGHWGNYFDPWLEHNGELVKGNGYITDDFTDHGLKFIAENHDKPFFLYLPYCTPHRPMQVPDKWWDIYEHRELNQSHRDPEKEDTLFTKAALAMCENIDWNVGRVLAKLEELELDENTIVIYFSDNGPNWWRWNDGMKGRKGTTDEGGIRAPFFIRWKGTLDAGKKITEIAGTIDLLPTLAELAGIEYQAEKPLDGISLEPLLTEDDPAWEDRLIFSYYRENSLSVRSRQYRLDGEGHLFDMYSDPGQKRDISVEKPEIAHRLALAAEVWEKDVMVELPKKETRPFTLGHPDYPITHMPARDGIAHGNIGRSNYYPNDTYFTNWIAPGDELTWDVEVLADGIFEVEIYYTCPAEDVGSSIELSFKEERVSAQINEAFDPPFIGIKNDRWGPRWVSDVKEFKALNMGTIHLKKGRETLTLKATDIPGSQAMDFRLMLFRRVDGANAI